MPHAVRPGVAPRHATNPGRYVVTTAKATTLTINCYKPDSRALSLPPGQHVVRVGEGCTATGATVTLHRAQMGLAPITVQHNITLPAQAVQRILATAEDSIAHSNARAAALEKSISSLQLETAETKESLRWLHSHGPTWTALGVAAATLVGAVGFFLAIGCCLRNRFNNALQHAITRHVLLAQPRASAVKFSAHEQEATAMI